jgi:hypothetical protein
MSNDIFNLSMGVSLCAKKSHDSEGDCFDIACRDVLFFAAVTANACFPSILIKTLNMNAFGWDTGKIYSSEVLPSEFPADAASSLQQKFYSFLQNFRLGNDYVYR